jgi:hypothetical protein
MMLRLRRGGDPGNGQNSQSLDHNNNDVVIAFSNNDNMNTSGEMEMQQQGRAGSSNIETISGTKRPREGTLHSFFGRSISQLKAASLIQQSPPSIAEVVVREVAGVTLTVQL